MDFREINGAGMRYDVTGEGPRTLVLLHEMCGCIETYDELVPMVAAGRRVIRYDWGGAGMSQKRYGTLTMQTLTGDLFGLLDALDVKGPVAVAGMAVGGAISLSAAAQAPDRIKAVVAMSPSTWIDPARKPVLLENIAKIEQNGIVPTQEASMNGNFPPALRPGNEEKFLRYRARWLGNDPRAYAAVYRMLVNLDMEAALASIKSPVLVLAGEHDGVRPLPLMQKVAAQIPGAQLKTTPGGHVMAMQTPREVANAMLEFLKPLNL
jgi:3-oxoadipate enol-lactonase